MKKKLTSVILSSLILMGAIGITVSTLTSDRPPLLGMNTEVSTLSVTSDRPPLLG